MGDRLYRSPTDRVIAGVAGGMATWLNVDPSLMRLAWILLGVVSGGIFVLVYLVMMIVVPLPPPGWVPRPRADAAISGAWQPPGTAPGAAPGTPGGWQQPGAPPPTGGWQAPPADAGWASVPPPATGPGKPDIDAGRAGIVGGVVLVVLGVWFLIDQYVDINWDLLWPVLLVAVGIAVIAVAVQRGRSSG